MRLRITCPPPPAPDLHGFGFHWSGGSRYCYFVVFPGDSMGRGGDIHQESGREGVTLGKGGVAKHDPRSRCTNVHLQHYSFTIPSCFMRWTGMLYFIILTFSHGAFQTTLSKQTSIMYLHTTDPGLWTINPWPVLPHPHPRLCLHPCFAINTRPKKKEKEKKRVKKSLHL